MERKQLLGGAAELEWHYSQNGTTPLLHSDSVHIVLLKERVNGDSRILSA